MDCKAFRHGSGLGFDKGKDFTPGCNLSTLWQVGTASQDTSLEPGHGEY